MDNVTYEQLFRDNYPALVNYASRILNNRSLAEEVVQNVFLKLWQKKENINISVSSVAYLYKSVFNASLNQKEHNEVIKKYIESSSIDIYFDYIVQSPSVELDIHSREIENAVIKASNKLPKRTKEVFFLSRMDGLKNKEIAQKMGITVKTVENQINIASKILKKELDWLLLLIILINK